MVQEKAHYAHTLPGRPPEEWQTLLEHLSGVAKLAYKFAEKFSAGEWGKIAGFLHDVGKYSRAFQEYIRACADEDHHAAERRGKVDHTSAGAQCSVRKYPVVGHLLAYAIAGHHAGLLDAISTDGLKTSLYARLKKDVASWEHGQHELPELEQPTLPVFLRRELENRVKNPSHIAFTFSFFTRMLFSCIVDADFLDTECFMAPERAQTRPCWPKDILDRMLNALDRYVESFPFQDTLVNRQRRLVREACIQAAQRPPGLFSLTVPTGGGKTLSSLTFALRHAILHRLDRVIYVIPFTSIIEQNAEVFRNVMASLVAAGMPDPVIEHHSALDAEDETTEGRLASENWDAPLIVTTSVQFYESLFSNRPSRCRKLHNIARSVVILDEVQKIPVDYLKPCLMALKELVVHYGTSVVLCTATQPAVHHREEFDIGLEGVTEIIEDPERLYKILKRVEVIDLGALKDEELAIRLIEEPQVLCIVNTRGHARRLYELLSQKNINPIHLSAAMCPVHRTEVLKTLRERLEKGERCQVIATQLIEAGVDVDFPVVYRSLAGIDSIAQAAGRCNRNGRNSLGLTYVFRSEHGRSEAFLRDTMNAASQLLGGGQRDALYEDILSLEAVEHYFRLYYWSQKERWDTKRLLNELNLQNKRELPFLFGFRTIAERFRLIEDTGRPVIVPWRDEGKRLCEELRQIQGLAPRRLLRRLQSYTVQVPMRQWEKHIGRDIQLVHDRYPVLVSPEIHYDEHLGLVLENERAEAHSFII